MAKRGSTLRARGDIRVFKQVSQDRTSHTSLLGMVPKVGLSIENDTVKINDAFTVNFPGVALVPNFTLDYLSSITKCDYTCEWPIEDLIELQGNDVDHFEYSTNLLDLFHLFGNRENQIAFLGAYGVLRDIDHRIYNTSPTNKFIRSMVGYTVRGIVMPPRILEYRPLPAADIHSLQEYIDVTFPYTRQLYAMARALDGKVPRILFFHLIGKYFKHRTDDVADFLNWVAHTDRFYVYKAPCNTLWHPHSDKQLINVFCRTQPDLTDQYAFYNPDKPHQLTAAESMIPGDFYHYLVDKKKLVHSDPDYWLHAEWFYRIVMLRNLARFIRSKNRGSCNRIPLPSKAAFNAMVMSRDKILHVAFAIMMSKYVPRDLVNNFTDSCGYDDLYFWIDHHIRNDDAILNRYLAWSLDFTWRVSATTDAPVTIRPINWETGQI